MIRRVSPSREEHHPEIAAMQLSREVLLVVLTLSLPLAATAAPQAGADDKGTKIPPSCGNAPGNSRFAFGCTPFVWIEGVDTPFLSRKAPLTFESLAKAGAPILWFSPDEPLLNIGAGHHGIPSRMLTNVLSSRTCDPESTSSEYKYNCAAVYYRVRSVHLRGGDLPTEDSRIRDARQCWSTKPSDLPIGNLDTVKIRYLFYYADDLGVGGHAHDLESLEVEFVIRKLTQIDAGERDLPPGWVGKYVAMMTKAAGSAHGAGWYTNVLDLEKAQDTQLPLTVLVEEGKHASAPDRNGDGRFTPGYDTNVQPNDGWGIRDTMRESRLGGARFTEDMDKRRLSTHLRFPSTLKPVNRQQPEALRIYESRHPEISPTWTNDSWYDLIWIGDDSDRIGDDSDNRRDEPQKAHLAQNVCVVNDTLTGFVAAYRLRPKDELRDVYARAEREAEREADQDEVGRLARTGGGSKAFSEFRGLLDEMGFCDEPVVRPDHGAIVRGLLAFGRDTILHPDGLGYTKGGESLSFAYRYDPDTGQGVSAAVPMGLEVPAVGGWLLGKLDLGSRSLSTWRTLTRIGVNALYTPSSSRAFDWYLSVGGDATRMTANDRFSWTPAQEAGVRIRFVAPTFPVLKFFGARIGARMNAFDHFKNARLVFEMGGGSW